MIEGIKLDFTSDELRSIIADRVIHHAERQEFYESQATSLEGNGCERNDYSGGDPVKGLRDKSKDHKTKAELFRVIGQHIVANEVYRLTESDLVRLELISRY